MYSDRIMWWGYFWGSEREGGSIVPDKKSYNIIDNNDLKEEDHNNFFWFVWPETLDKDLEKLNGIADNDNIRRK